MKKPSALFKLTIDSCREENILRTHRRPGR